jgi:hypothetical protein
MNDAHQARQRRDAASALRAQRRTNAVVAQYLQELSGRRLPAGGSDGRVRGDEHVAKAAIAEAPTS